MICLLFLQKYFPFQYEPNNRVSVQSEKLKQSLKYDTFNNKDTRTTPLKLLILNILNNRFLNVKKLSHLILVLKLLTLNR